MFLADSCLVGDVYRCQQGVSRFTCSIIGPWRGETELAGVLRGTWWFAIPWCELSLSLLLRVCVLDIWRITRQSRCFVSERRARLIVCLCVVLVVYFAICPSFIAVFTALRSFFSNHAFTFLDIDRPCGRHSFHYSFAGKHQFGVYETD